jgi:hypothetical protein
MQHAGKIERQFLGQYPLVYPQNLKRVQKLYTKALRSHAVALKELLEPRETSSLRLNRILDIAELGTSFTRADFQAWGMREKIGSRTVDRWIGERLQKGTLERSGHTKTVVYWKAADIGEEANAPTLGRNYGRREPPRIPRL